MFEAFYEMSTTPFTRGIPSQELYMPPELEEVENQLKYVAQRQLFAVLTVDCGTGKTTILRKFAHALDTNRYKLLYLSDSKLTPRNFYRILLRQMGFLPKYNRGDAKRQLHEEIAVMKAVYGIQPVCVCDEFPRHLPIILSGRQLQRESISSGKRLWLLSWPFSFPSRQNPGKRQGGYKIIIYTACNPSLSGQQNRLILAKKFRMVLDKFTR